MRARVGVVIGARPVCLSFAIILYLYAHDPFGMGKGKGAPPAASCGSASRSSDSAVICFSFSPHPLSGNRGIYSCRQRVRLTSGSACGAVAGVVCFGAVIAVGAVGAAALYCRRNF